MSNKRVADVLVDTLVAAGVKNIYGLAGDSLNGITDSIRTRDNINWIPVRHEETAAFAAGADLACVLAILIVVCRAWRTRSAMACNNNGRLVIASR